MGVDPNWGLLNGGGFQNALALGMQFGQQARQRADEKQYRNALTNYDPNNPDTIKPIMAADPKLGFELRQQQAQQQQAAQTQRRNDLPIMGRLLDHATDEQTYQQALQLAQRYGLDTTDAPPNYDPQWVASTKQLVAAVQTPEGQQALSNAGKQAEDMGFKPGTPEFHKAVHDIFVAGAAQPYTGSQGETRLYVPQIGGQGEIQGAAPPQQTADAPAIIKQAASRGYILPDEAAAVKAQLGPNGQAAMEGWLKQNNIRVAVRTGTAPDGRKVVQFEDGTVDYAD